MAGRADTHRSRRSCHLSSSHYSIDDGVVPTLAGSASQTILPGIMGPDSEGKHRGKN